MANDARDTSLVGVYSAEQVPAVVEALHREGLDPDAVAVGDRDDAVGALRAEMQQETNDAWISPQAGLAYSKESARGGAGLTVLLAAIGGVLFAPFGLIPMGDLPLWSRILLMAAIGVFAFGAIGAVAGPALSVRRPNDPMAAERGVTVRVASDAPNVTRAMVAAHPIRLDRVDATGATLSTVSTEDDGGPGGVARSMAEHLRDPRSDLVSPDSTAPTPRDRSDGGEPGGHVDRRPRR